MSKTSTEEGINRSVELQPLPGFSYGLYDAPTCVMCGCTENVPCFDGEQACFWVTINNKTNAGLCSECVGF
jgi:hypothetical protein